MFSGAAVCTKRKSYAGEKKTPNLKQALSPVQNIVMVKRHSPHGVGRSLEEEWFSTSEVCGAGMAGGHAGS